MVVSKRALKKNGKTHSKRFKGAGQKPLDENMEEELFDWIMDLRGRNVCIFVGVAKVCM